jgi:hypothetical protein
MAEGVYKTTRKDGSASYRVSIYREKKHISLGSFSDEETAATAYREAVSLYNDSDINILNFRQNLTALSPDKAVTILNHRDHKVYIKTPIYLENGFFTYYLEGVGHLKFDNDDLFYYSSHRILNHNGHLYVNDYGSQYGILGRYGIKNYAVAGRDYIFANGDPHDLRYANIIVINKYHGVCQILQKELIRYEAKIHLVGDYLIGRYESDAEAAVAYNKAVDAAVDHGFQKNFIQNYVLEYTPKEYADVYTRIQLPASYLNYLKRFPSANGT